MADNLAVTPGSGATVAADDVGSALHQQVKIEYGADGTATPVSTTNPLPITTANDTRIGSLTETAPSADTDSSGLNGRLQRIAQRLTTIIAGIPLSAGTALIGKIIAHHETSALYNGTTALTPKFIKVAVSSSGVNEAIALVSAKKIRVLAAFLSVAGTVNVKFQSHVTPTDLTGLLYGVATVGIVLPYNPLGWFETVSGEALDLNLSTATAVGGVIVYVEV